MTLYSMARRGCEMDELLQLCDRWGVTRVTANKYLSEVTQRVLKALEQKYQ